MNFPNKFYCECREFSTFERNVPAPIFRRSFSLGCDPDASEILVSGLGFYELFVNGHRITKGNLAPYISNTDHYVYFDRYDIREYLKKGENVIGVMLGDGFLVGKTKSWAFKDNIINSAPMLALSAEIKCGSETVSFGADSFVCKKGPVIFNDLRAGCFYDARLFEKGWCESGFSEKDWHAPILATSPRGTAKLCEAEPIKTYREIKPIKITNGSRDEYVCSGQIADFLASITPFEAPASLEGGYIYDFGENNAGVFRLKINGERGQKVSLQCAEQLVDGKINYNNINLYPDGFSQRDIYILSGEGEEIFEPMFTYHGYRYIYVTGITDAQATPELLTYLVQGSSLEDRGTFECSDPVANKIYEMGRKSDISNFFYFPTDCPHREKNGWTGDASASAEHMIMTIGAENSWREWLHNIRASQKEDGMLPGIVPTVSWGYEWGNGPAWDSVIFNLPFFAYKYRGETVLIKENAHAMLRYLEYISRKRDERGLVNIGLGDWVPVNRVSHDYEAELSFTNGAMIVDICRKASEMFSAIGLEMSRKFADTLGCEMREAVRAEYIDFETMTVKKRCQTSQAMAIFYRIFDDRECQKAFDVLMEIIEHDRYSITSGFLGLRVIFHVLSQFGQADVAYKMITKKEYPSYGYWAERGETTFLEHFLPYDGYYPVSKNHHFLGDVVNWLMREIGGLDVQNSRSVYVCPKFINGLEFAKTGHRLPGGDISITWKREGDCVWLNVKTCGDVMHSALAPSGWRITSRENFLGEVNYKYSKI